MVPVAKFRKEKRPHKTINVVEMLSTRDRISMGMATLLV